MQLTEQHVNGAYNILRKSRTDAFAKRIAAYVIQPLRLSRINPTGNMACNTMLYFLELLETGIRVMNPRMNPGACSRNSRVPDCKP
jgi:hypothetical protein